MYHKSLPLFVLIILFFVSIMPVWANETITTDYYQKQIYVPATDRVVPTVVEVLLPEIVPYNEKFVVVENTTDRFIPYRLHTNTEVIPHQWQVAVPAVGVGDESALVDGDLDTAVDFPITRDAEVHTAHITLSADEAVTTAQLELRLDRFVAVPSTVEVVYVDPVSNQYVVALAETEMSSTVITFPEITTTEIMLAFTYTQPLRVSEVTVRNTAATIEKTQGVRFLAQPDTSYTLYYQSDSTEGVPVPEAGNLSADEGILPIYNLDSVPNPDHRPFDRDDDGVPDRYDNCVGVANPDQVDLDQNNRGDACDDFDRDGHINVTDNCIEQPNRNQLDTDGDGVGDACDNEESRFTEANPWIPWFGMGTALVVILLLFMIVGLGPERRRDTIK